MRRGVPDLEVERRCIGPAGDHRTALQELKCVVGDRIREVVGFLIEDPIADHRCAVVRASAKLVCVPMAEPEARCRAVSEVPLAREGTVVAMCCQDVRVGGDAVEISDGRLRSAVSVPEPIVDAVMRWDASGDQRRTRGGTDG